MDKTGLTEITATVLQQTKNSIEGMCEVSGLSIGEIIDRMALKWSAKDPEHATQLILDDMIIHTRNLSPEDTRISSRRPIRLFIPPRSTQEVVCINVIAIWLITALPVFPI